jgi:hypothetical protein
MATRIMKGAAAGVLGLLTVVAPMAAAPASAAYSFEWNNAVAGMPNLDSLACIATPVAEACFQANGDKIWVKDTSSDWYSGVARWYTDYGRWGTCRNALGAGKWGVCNKNLAEGHTFSWRASRYDADTDAYIGPESALMSRTS